MIEDFIKNIFENKLVYSDQSNDNSIAIQKKKSTK